MIRAALMLAFGGVLPFLCATPAIGDGVQAQMAAHAHHRISEMPVLVEPDAEHGCAEAAPPLLSRDGGPGLIAGFAGYRNLMLEGEAALVAPLLVPDRAVINRAMFQVYRL